FVKDPSSVLKVGQRVRATVMEVDLQRKRIALSLKTNPEVGPREPRSASGPSNASGPRREGPPRSDSRPQAPQTVDWFTAATQKKR
ncbi:MAG: S1 RNA-binding domain-containing protein, partial [Chthoniobacteraceae bacterium]|nr:S1 RNA-binding domain-containing protein [Chthoniobacteraceae bacterium]